MEASLSFLRMSTVAKYELPQTTRKGREAVLKSRRFNLPIAAEWKHSAELCSHFNTGVVGRGSLKLRNLSVHTLQYCENYQCV